MMTKAQFDDEFLHEKCVVEAVNLDEWQRIYDYAISKLNVHRPLLIGKHDCDRYPYVSVNKQGRLDAIDRIGQRIALTFNEWLEVIEYDEEDVDLQSASLIDVL